MGEYGGLDRATRRCRFFPPMAIGTGQSSAGCLWICGQAVRLPRLSPNPPMNTDGRRENSGRGVRELQGRWSGLHWGRSEVGGGSSVVAQGPYGRLRTLGRADGGERTQQETLAERAGASWRGRSVVRGVAQAPALLSDRKWNRSQPCQGAADLGFPGPALGKMQSESARRAGEASGQGEESSPQGLGGHQLLAQTDARCPTGQIMRQHLDGQPGPLRQAQDWRRNGLTGDD